MPSCTRMTDNEHGFLGGHPVIQAADGGNNMRIFNTGAENVRTYGIAFAGCNELDASCGLYPYMSLSIVCLLPPDVCR